MRRATSIVRAISRRSPDTVGGMIGLGKLSDSRQSCAGYPCFTREADQCTWLHRHIRDVPGASARGFVREVVAPVAADPAPSNESPTSASIRTWWLPLPDAWGTRGRLDRRSRRRIREPSITLLELAPGQFAIFDGCIGSMARTRTRRPNTTRTTRVRMNRVHMTSVCWRVRATRRDAEPLDQHRHTLYDRARRRGLLTPASHSRLPSSASGPKDAAG